MFRGLAHRIWFAARPRGLCLYSVQLIPGDEPESGTE